MHNKQFDSNNSSSSEEIRLDHTIDECIPHQTISEEPLWLRELQTLEPIKIEIEHLIDIHHLRIVVISDTHGFHQYLKFPPCPEGKKMILIHCGDMTDHGTLEEIEKFNQWLGEVKSNFSQIYCIAGNHEIELSKFSPEEIKKTLLTNCIYLQDEEFTIGGLKFYATPWCPNMFDWLCFKFEKLLNQPEKLADIQSYDDQFFFKNELELEKIFAKIPQDVDILITHCPPKYILECNEFGSHRGCPKLLERLLDLHKLKIHLFGHIHSTYGYKFLRRSDVVEAATREKELQLLKFNHNSSKDQSNDDNILFVNAANSHKYQPFYFDI